jgi:hypothetical protein
MKMLVILSTRVLVFQQGKDARDVVLLVLKETDDVEKAGSQPFLCTL